MLATAAAPYSAARCCYDAMALSACSMIKELVPRDARCGATPSHEADVHQLQLSCLRYGS